MPQTESAPLISVLMANYNCAAFLREALQSVLAQTYRNLEIILVDDGSSDESLAIAGQIASTDPRLRIFSGFRFGGPAPVRNFALEQAKGEWVAIVDSDDHIHPERFSRLLAHAEDLNADILIDDLLIFSDQSGAGQQTLYSGKQAREICHISISDYVTANCLYGSGSGLGYAKPIIRRACLERHSIRYNEAMRIGEDYDLVYRLMRQGSTLVSVPDLFYFYRKHSGSISHRLDRGSLDALYDAARGALAKPHLPQALLSALSSRLRSIENAIAYDKMIGALKARNLPLLFKTCIKTPTAMPLLSMPIVDRLKSKFKKPKTDHSDVAVIVRQRIVGNTNGSSAYLLALCRYLSSQGLTVSMYWPSPETFGRWPVLILKPELAFLKNMQWRGGIKLGRYVFSKVPGIYWSFIQTAVEAVLLKLKLVKKPFVPNAISALKAPYRREDILFLARHVTGSKAIIADYAFCTPYLDYTLTPARSLVLMHDLFSSRPGQFTGAKVIDDYGHFTFEQEITHLSKADAVIAIQAEEAAKISPFLYNTSVIVAPMSAETVEAPRPGNDSSLFFVGSSAAPNVLALQWFFAEVWPIVMERRPETVLKVAGTVGRAVSQAPQNVSILGLVDDLAQLYSEAGVVISPLTTGSGLKIKIIEALAQGKACVVTAVTLQGIVDIVGEAVTTADTAEAFAAGIIALLDNPQQRAALGEMALKCVRANFSPQQSFQSVLEFATHNTGG